MNRNLDGCYFRVKRDGKYQSVCFSDLTDKEREEIGKDRPAEWWRELAFHLADCLQGVGDALNLVCEDNKLFYNINTDKEGQK